LSKAVFIIHDNYQEDNHFPVGIGYLAAVLEKEGVDVNIINQDIYHYSNKKVAEMSKSLQPDIIGLGFLAARFKETVLPLCKEINKVKGDSWLVLGGHGASGCPEYMLEQTGCDEVFIGESERMDFAEGDKYPIKGWGYVKDLDTIPFPAWHLFPIDKYADAIRMPGWQKGDKTLGILTSRGCVGKCNFCYRMHEGLRVRSIDSVIEEMTELFRTYGINYFFMQDELFVSSKKRMFEFHEGLKNAGLIGRIKFACDSRVNIVDDDLLECLRDSGCKYLDYGFESMDDEVLKTMRKGQTAKQNIKAASLTREAGIPFNMNFLWGNIGDTPQSLQANIEFIKEYNTYDVIRTIRPPTPYPGCELFDIAVQNGLLKDAADFFDKFTNSDKLTVNFTDMPDDEFYAYLLQANSELILDHYQHQASDLSTQFGNLYFKDEQFRGARHYDVQAMS